MYKPVKTKKVKQNNSLSLSYHYQNEDGSDIDLSRASIKSYIKNSDKNLILVCNVVKTDLTKGKFNIEVDSIPFEGDGILFLDVKVIINGKAKNNEIIRLVVSEVVTDD